MLKMRLIRDYKNEWDAIMALPQFEGASKISFEDLIAYSLEAEGRMRQSGLRKSWFDGARIMIVSGGSQEPGFRGTHRIQVTLFHEYGDWWIKSAISVFSAQGWARFFLPTDIPKPEKVGFFGRIRKLLEAL